jgi:hypothetical protein
MFMGSQFQSNQLKKEKVKTNESERERESKQESSRVIVNEFTD